jgi:hypothetical protein
VVCGYSRLEGGSPCLCRLRTVSLWPRRAMIEQYSPLVGFMGPDKLSSLVTTWSNGNHYSKADRREGK